MVWPYIDSSTTLPKQIPGIPGWIFKLMTLYRENTQFILNELSGKTPHILSHQSGVMDISPSFR